MIGNWWRRMARCSMTFSGDLHAEYELSSSSGGLGRHRGLMLNPTLVTTAIDTPFARIEWRLSSGELIEAAADIDRWLDAKPEDAGALTARAMLFRLCGQYGDAASLLERSYARAPQFAPTLVEFARLACIDQRLECAHRWYEEAHRVAPDATQWFDEWITLQHRMERADRAAEIARRWCNACPDIGRARFRLGFALQSNNAFPDALAAYGRVLTMDAKYPSLHKNLAVVHFWMENYDAAFRCNNEAIRLCPDDVLAWTNLAQLWIGRQNAKNALIAAERATALGRDYPPALLAHSNVLKEFQRWDEALADLLHAARFAPQDPKIKWSIAMLQLLHGDYRNGLINHEARCKGSNEMAKVEPLPPDQRWNGESLAGKTLLVWGEQGFGDVLQFVRFLPYVAERVRQARGTLIYCCPREVFTLLSRSLAGLELHLVANDAPQPLRFDFHIPLASLPLALGVTLDTLPAPRAYLRPDAARVTRWSRRLARVRALKVGIVWSGNRAHQRNPLRSVSPLDYVVAFGPLRNVEFFSLQINGAADVASMAAHGLRVTDYTAGIRSFDDSAALIASLDLVVTVCTSVAHLAAGLGVPTWLLLDVNPHWVWMIERSDSPWYPSVRIYRQRQYRDWHPVLEQVRADLATLARRGAER
jgi:tetratricopeptide (TPR) repeat protein